MKDGQQKTLATGKETTFQMALYRSQFLVKNFTDDAITVRIGDNTGVSIIGAGSWERVFNNVVLGDPDDHGIRPNRAEVTNIVKITANADGMVEVASID